MKCIKTTCFKEAVCNYRFDEDTLNLIVYELKKEDKRGYCHDHIKECFNKWFEHLKEYKEKNINENVDIVERIKRNKYLMEKYKDIGIENISIKDIFYLYTEKELKSITDSDRDIYEGGKK